MRQIRKNAYKYETGTLEFTPSCDISILDDQLYYMQNYLKMLRIRVEIEDIDLN